MKKFLSAQLHSIRGKILILFIIIMALLLALMMWFTRSREENLINRISDANRSLLMYHAGIMERELKSAELFFSEQKLMRSSYLAAENASDELDQYLTSSNIRNTLEFALFEAEVLDAIFFYSPEREHLIYCPDIDNTLTEEFFFQEIRSHLSDYMYDEGRWTARQINDEYFLVYMIRIHNSYIGGLIDTDRLISDVNLTETDVLQDVLLLDDSYNSLSKKLSVQDKEALTDSVKRDTDRVKVGNNLYMTSLAGFENGHFYLLGLTADSVIFQKKQTESAVLVAGVLLIIIIAVVLIHLLWKLLVKPLSNITDGMNRLKEGDFSYHLQEENSSEFAQITSTFNSMSDNIEHLKIAVYEEQLEHQKTELQFLQSQLNPHFLINCINNLRTVALQGNESVFQTMLIDLGTYLRGNMTMQQLIPLENEIKNVRAYVQLQQIRYQNRIHIDIQIYEELLSVMVPVHIVQTFVGNSVKYSLSSDNEVNISITGDLSENADDMLIINIDDDGPGFSPEILKQLAQTDAVMKEGRECIGISNAIMRLKLLFGERSWVICRNNECGGAHVEMVIPIEEDIDESTDP